MATNLLRETAPEVAKFVAESGMRVVSQYLDRAVFGNVIVIASGQYFNMRVVQDRGHVAVDLSPPGKQEWHDLRNIMGFITKEPPTSDVPALVRKLATNLSKVTALMTSDLDEVGFVSFEKQESALLMEKIFPPRNNVTRCHRDLPPS
jgi:hypothetical protein